MSRNKVIYILLSVLCFFPLLSLGASKTTLTAMRVLDTQDAMRVIFNLSSPTVVHFFTLEQPDRLVFDFRATQLGFRFDTLHVTSSYLKTVRKGHPDGGTLRIVLDVRGPFIVKRISPLKGMQMVVDVYPHGLSKRMTGKNAAASVKGSFHGLNNNSSLPTRMSEKMTAPTDGQFHRLNDNGEGDKKRQGNQLPPADNIAEKVETASVKGQLNSLNNNGRADKKGRISRLSSTDTTAEKVAAVPVKGQLNSLSNNGRADKRGQITRLSSADTIAEKVTAVPVKGQLNSLNNNGMADKKGQITRLPSLDNTAEKATTISANDVADKKEPTTRLSSANDKDDSPSAKTTPQLPSRPFVVVVDAGHGGKDTGAIGFYKTKEKDIVLAIATQLADLINQQPHMRAVMTRKGDYFVPLANRLVLARKGEADLFIAIHADSYFNDRASGASVFALSAHGATTVAARWLSDIDNHSELGGVELNHLNDHSYLLRSVLIDLAQTATIRDSLLLGHFILDGLHKVTRLHAPYVEQAPFMVLKSPDIPSVLVETGFISNEAEELRLRDKAYQHKIALALFNGIRLYQKKYVSVGM